MQTCGFTHRTTRHIAVQIVLKVEQASNCAHGNGIKSCGPDKRVTQSILLEILVTRVRKKRSIDFGTAAVGSTKSFSSSLYQNLKSCSYK